VGIHAAEYCAFFVNMGTFFEEHTTTFLMYMTILCTKIEVFRFGMILKEFMRSFVELSCCV
jgi:hypothetical protein